MKQRLRDTAVNLWVAVRNGIDQVWRTACALWWTLLLVAGAFALFAWIPERYESTTDPSLLLYVAGAYTVGGLAMLAYTRDWNLIGRGMLLTIMGDALLYISVSLPAVAATRPFWRRFAWYMETTEFVSQHWISDVIRACFAIGASLFLLGVVRWIRRNRVSQPQTMMDPLENGEPP